MVNLIVSKNIVLLPKDQEDTKKFIAKYLTKYEEVKKKDYYAGKGSTKLRTVLEKRELFTQDDIFIKFARGILELIPDNEYTIEYDSGNSLTPPNLDDEEIATVLPQFRLRDDQVLAIKKCSFAKRGIIQLPTAIGKSAIISGTIKRIQEANPEDNTLVLAPTLSTVKNIAETLKESGLEVEIFNHPHKEIVSPVTVSLVQSLVNKYESNPDLLKSITSVYYDECLSESTKILLPNGLEVTAKEVYLNDDITEVLSFNFETKKCEVKPILRKIRNEHDGTFLKIRYYDNLEKKITDGPICTYNHKIWTKNRGYVQAQNLTEDDWIKIDYPFLRGNTILDDKTYVRFSDKTRKIKINTTRKKWESLGKEGKYKCYRYNFEIADNHNYYANRVLVSNCHHLKCDTWNTLNEMLPNVEYALGFSALSIDKNEIYINDFSQLNYQTSLIVGSTGKVLMHLDPSYYIKKGIIATPLIFRIQTNQPLPETFDESKWHNLVKTAIMSSYRSYIVAEIAKTISKYNRKVLILVAEKEHAFKICDFFRHLEVTDYGISFGAGKGYTYKSTKQIPYEDPFKPGGIDYKTETEYNNVDSMEVVDKFNKGELRILIATSHLDEGVDIKALDACILAGSGQKDRRIIQRVGRVLRKTKNGTYAYVIDFTDMGSKVLSRQSENRLKIYKEGLGVPDEMIFEIPVEQFENKFVEIERL